MKTLLLILCLIACALQVRATGIMQFTSGTASVVLEHATSMRASAVMNDQIVTTTVRERFVQNRFGSASATYGYPLLSTQMVSGVRLWVDGLEYKTAIAAGPVDTTHSSSGSGAQKLSTIQQYFSGFGYKQTAFQMPIKESLNLDAVIEIEVTVIELLNYSSGTSTYTYLLKDEVSNTRLFSDSASRSAFSIHIDIHNTAAINNVMVPPGATLTMNLGGTDATVDYSAASVAAAKFCAQEAIVQVSSNENDIKPSFFSNKPSDEDGHFVFVLRPSANLDSQALIPKTFTFVIDRSGSMLGIKIQQAKEAAAYCVTHLNPQDRFNVIAFNDAISRFQPAPVSATPDNMIAAQQYINSITAGGGTNLQDASLSALAQYADTGTVNVMVFLTDGIATLDQALVRSKNGAHVRICVFGVGSDVNSQQLSSLASLNNGISTFITEVQSTSDVIAAFYDHIRYPIWRNISVSFSPTQTHDIYPTIVPDLNIGEQICMSGRYVLPGPAIAHVHAFSGTSEINKDYPVVFSADSMSDLFSPKIWARMRIDFLKELMNKEGAQTSRWLEWRAEIVRLGLRYGLVTEFTTYQDTGTVSEVENSNDALAVVSVYPNPCDTWASIRLNLESSEDVEVVIYDLSGRQVIQLYHAFSPSGALELRWDLLDASGTKVQSGTYLCVVRIGNKELLRTLTITR